MAAATKTTANGKTTRTALLALGLTTSYSIKGAYKGCPCGMTVAVMLDRAMKSV
ncbi:hypothetical protein EYZ11_011681 [Aspergillus tanneri]|uniref:Uncharacterized protein n=1 Tax=Aspergillus tanneri TaxID=1220188 RepID=A0A4S3J260_9EURO|nr:hypothetical protein EYZ11_011681 [Aspergillus tanneri]